MDFSDHDLWNKNPKTKFIKHMRCILERVFYNELNKFSKTY